jgi:hypothetical protein
MDNLNCLMEAPKAPTKAKTAFFSYSKVGGLRFVRLGRLGFNFYLARKIAIALAALTLFAGQAEARGWHHSSGSHSSHHSYRR